MRIPHHLIRTPSGTYAFRQRVPSDLQAVTGCKLFKQTLRTANLASARLRAIVLASGYAHAYDVLRDRRVDRFSKKDLEALVERLSGGADRRDMTLHRTQAADGTITERWQIDSDDDVRLFRQAQSIGTVEEVAAIGRLDPEPNLVRENRPQVTETITLEKARDAWLASIKPRTLPKTFTIKTAAVESLVAVLGPKSKLHTVWYQHHVEWVHSKWCSSYCPILANRCGGEGAPTGCGSWRGRDSCRDHGFAAPRQADGLLQGLGVCREVWTR
jgi:uncharacterized protein (DUF1778 family)